MKTAKARESAMADLTEQIAGLLLQRKSYQAIADICGVSIGTVANYRAKILAQWRESSAADANELFTAIFADYALIRNEALAAWERSKGNKETRTIKDTIDGTETTEKSEGQCGDASFLAQAQKALDSMRELRGIDAPKQIVQTNIDGGEMPEATAALMNDPDVRKALLAAERKHEDSRKAQK